MTRGELISAMLFVDALFLLLQNEKILLLEIPLLAGTFIYAIVSSVQIKKKEKK